MNLVRVVYFESYRCGSLASVRQGACTFVEVSGKPFSYRITILQHCKDDITDQFLEIKNDELNQNSKEKPYHCLALVSIGAMSYIIADIAHEAIGHGGACLIAGEKITLLTSVYFRSAIHSFITDAFGPLTNLAIGLLLWTLLRKANHFKAYTQLLLLHTMTFNLFWFSWLCFYAGITNKGDFAFNIGGVTELLTWRIFLIVVGILSYRTFFYLIVGSALKIFNSIKNNFSTQQLRQLFLIPYLSAGISALIAVSFFSPHSIDTFIEAINFPMFFPMLLIPGYLRKSDKYIHRETSNLDQPFLTKQQLNFICYGVIIFTVFCLTMGRGMRF